MVIWKPPKAIPIDGGEIVMLTNQGIVTAWYNSNSNEWVCYDDAFRLACNDELSIVGAEILGWASIEELMS